jgi:hypothetical protein
MMEFLVAGCWLLVHEEEPDSPCVVFSVSSA